MPQRRIMVISYIDMDDEFVDPSFNKDKELNERYIKRLIEERAHVAEMRVTQIFPLLEDMK